MAHSPVVHLGENSPEQVAYKLMRDIALAEGIGLGIPNSPRCVPNGSGLPNRKWILETYSECLAAVRGGRVPGN